MLQATTSSVQARMTCARQEVLLCACVCLQSICVADIAVEREAALYLTSASRGHPHTTHTCRQIQQVGVYLAQTCVRGVSAWRFLVVAERKVVEQRARTHQRIDVIVTRQVSDARLGAVRVRAAELVHRHVLVCHSLDHLRLRDQNFASYRTWCCASGRHRTPSVSYPRVLLIRQIAIA